MAHPQRNALTGAEPFKDALQSQKDHDEGHRSEERADDHDAGESVVAYHPTIREDPSVKGMAARAGGQV